MYKFFYSHTYNANKAIYIYGKEYNIYRVKLAIKDQPQTMECQEILTQSNKYMFL